MVKRTLGKLGLSKTVRKQKELKKDMWYILRDIHVDKLLEYVTDNPNNMNENTTGYYAAKDKLMDEVNNAIESNELVKMRADAPAKICGSLRIMLLPY